MVNCFSLMLPERKNNKANLLKLEQNNIRAVTINQVSFFLFCIALIRKLNPKYNICYLLQINISSPTFICQSLESRDFCNLQFDIM